MVQGGSGDAKTPIPGGNSQGAGQSNMGHNERESTKNNDASG